MLNLFVSDDHTTCRLSLEIEIDRAIYYMRHKEFSRAIELLKGFEKKDDPLKAMAATNLSFIYLLEGEIKISERYANLAYEHDRYNARALVNKANCLAIKGDFEVAKHFYLEAIGVEVGCIEAILNLGLVYRKLEIWHEALVAFEKVHQLVPANTEVIYQLATLHEAQGRPDCAFKWYNILVARGLGDPQALLRMGHIHNSSDEDTQALHFYLESYRQFPVCLDAISWLGVWYVKLEMYEEATHFFERASEVQPGEVKWLLMVASCSRRMRKHQCAHDLYEFIHAQHPDNTECLRYLVALRKDLGKSFEAYSAKLNLINQQEYSARQDSGHTNPTTSVPCKTQRCPIADENTEFCDIDIDELLKDV